MNSMEEFDANKKYIFVFRSIHDVIRSERLIKSIGINYQIVTLPTKISSDCGMCILLDGQSVMQFIRELVQNEITHKVYPK